jgi:serine/threonine protein kinase
MSALTRSAESTWNPVVGSQLLPGLLAWDQLGCAKHFETWRAWSTERWAPVVVKLPHPGEVAEADTLQDLVLEARSRGLVEHPGFQRMWDARLEGARVPHLVLEYVEGQSLASMIDQRVLTTTDVVLLGMQLASSLRYLHRRGLVHLDVKPTNVVIRDGRAVLVDLASMTPTGRRYPVGRAPGTPSFRARELSHGGAVGPATDTFALGVTLYEALVRAPAFETSQPEPPPDSVQRLRSVAPPVTEVAPSLADLVLRMLAAEPESRPDDDALLRLLSAELPADRAPSWPRWATRSLQVTPRTGPSTISRIRPASPSPALH